MFLVYATCKSAAEARKIGETAVKEKLAACSVVIPRAESFYFWKGKPAKAREAILLLKCAEKNYARLEKRVIALHSYEVPCVLAFKVARGSAGYLKWVEGVKPTVK